MNRAHPKKRIVLCCDGTWKDSDGAMQVPSNVTRLARSVKPVGLDSNGEPTTQVVFYQNGVGTGSRSLYTKYVGGATGEGIGNNIREAYSFLCHNYHDGDEIFIFGFSRGAFTARSVSSFVKALGLLTPAGLRYLTPIFEDWKHQGNKSYKSQYKVPWANRTAVGSEEYQRKLLQMELTRPSIQIKCVAVWETVGALGIPRVAILPQAPATDYAFVDTIVESNIEYAYQALALDEKRRSYQPTIWEKPAGQALPRVLKQTWFPGSHSDVGDHELITREIRLSKEAHEALNEHVREWGLGKIHNSMSLFFRILGSQSRTPKEYYEVDRVTRKYTGRRLENTCETVHSSVRIRMGREGLGYDDKGYYDSSALKGWTMCGVETNPETPIAKGLPGPVGKMNKVVWKKTSHGQGIKGVLEHTALEMPEDTLHGFERRLLSLWPELAREFDAVKPGRHKTELVKATTYPIQSPDSKRNSVKLTDAIPERIKSLSRHRGEKSSMESGRGSDKRLSSSVDSETGMVKVVSDSPRTSDDVVKPPSRTETY